MIHVDDFLLDIELLLVRLVNTIILFVEIVKNENEKAVERWTSKRRSRFNFSL